MPFFHDLGHVVPHSKSTTESTARKSACITLSSWQTCRPGYAKNLDSCALGMMAQVQRLLGRTTGNARLYNLNRPYPLGTKFLPMGPGSDGPKSPQLHTSWRLGFARGFRYYARNMVVKAPHSPGGVELESLETEVTGVKSCVSSIKDLPQWSDLLKSIIRRSLTLRLPATLLLLIELHAVLGGESLQSVFVDPNDNFTLSAFNFPLSGGLRRRGLATGDEEIVWCCENSTSYITIRTPMQVWSDPSFDAVKTLHLAIKNVEAQVFKYGIARLPGGQTLQQLSPRQDDSFPVCHVGTKAECPGFYPDASPECLASNAQNAIDDVGLLVYAALRALYSKSPNPASPGELPKGDISPAPHYFYFFDNNKAVANFVASIFRSIYACSQKQDCPFNIVFCDNNRPWPNACQTPPGRYGYVRDPNQHVAALNNRGKGGGSVFLCPAGLALARNAAPCSQDSANMGQDTLGTGLLGQLVQVDVITRPDVGFLAKHTGGWENITVLDHDTLNGSHDYTTSMAQGMTLMELGFGVNGEGLREKGLANAQNYVDFAKWSYDMNYAATAGAAKCDDKFDAFRKRVGAEPITG
ncbi:MAG: hypothetical protein Q9182_006266 [Xanthomendoza sp. 2 TL-2023]